MIVIPFFNQSGLRGNLIVSLHHKGVSDMLLISVATGHLHSIFRLFDMESQSKQKEHFLILINDFLILINDFLILINDFLILINDFLIFINGMIY